MTAAAHFSLLALRGALKRRSGNPDLGGPVSAAFFA
jgi:hypothetical protein